MDFNFGKNLANLRKEKHFTQLQLSEMICVTPQAISRWENNETMPDLNMVVLLAQIYGVSIDYLVTGMTKEESIESKDNDVIDDPFIPVKKREKITLYDTNGDGY